MHYVFSNLRVNLTENNESHAGRLIAAMCCQAPPHSLLQPNCLNLDVVSSSFGKNKCPEPGSAPVRLYFPERACSCVKRRDHRGTGRLRVGSRCQALLVHWQPRIGELGPFTYSGFPNSRTPYTQILDIHRRPKIGHSRSSQKTLPWKSSFSCPALPSIPSKPRALP